MVSAALCVLDAFLAVGAVAVHDGKDHVSLEVLGERKGMRGIRGFGGTTGWLTPHFAHRVPSLDGECGECNAGLGKVTGGTYAILRHIVGESGEGAGMVGTGQRVGGRGNETGVIHSCCGIADRIYRRQRKWATDDGKRKRWVDGRVASRFWGNFFSFFFPEDLRLHICIPEKRVCS